LGGNFILVAAAKASLDKEEKDKAAGKDPTTSARMT